MRNKLARQAGTLALGLTSLAGAQGYSGPQAVVFIGEKWCSGAYCSGNVYAAFDEALTKALTSSGYVRAVRKPDGASLDMKATITDVSGGGGLCLPILGCVSGKTVRASMELLDHQSGELKWQDTCEGTSAGYSAWSWWTGSVNLNSDDGKAAADCAGKLVQKLTASQVLKPYLMLAPGAAVGSGGAAPTPTPTTPSTPASPTQAGTGPVQLLEPALKTLAFADLNALFTSDPFNPVKLKALNAAATQATLDAAASMKFSVTPGEKAGPYQLVGLTYTLPDGTEKYVQLAVTSDPTLNSRGGTKILYLSALNPLRSSNAALDGVSKNVETLLNDLTRALGLPGL